MTDSRQFAQYPTSGVFADGSNDHAADVRVVALGSMGYLSTPSLAACEAKIARRVALDLADSAVRFQVLRRVSPLDPSVPPAL
jgi:hypothetical protein